MADIPRSASGQFVSRGVQSSDIQEQTVSIGEGEVPPVDEETVDDEELWEDQTPRRNVKAKRPNQGTRRSTTLGRTSSSEGRTTPSTGRVPPPPANVVDPATFQNSMFQMMQMLTQSITTQTQGQRTSASPGVYGTKEPKIKDPETFNGTRDQLNAFITECMLVFELQPSRFPDDRTRVGYMVSLLRGTALMAVRPHLSATTRPLFLLQYTNFVEYLKTNFGDPDEKGTARRKLKALRQVNSASAYFSEFQQYIAILGWMDQDPIVDKAIDGLKPTLKDELARIGKRPESLSELIDFVIPLDNRLFEREQERSRESQVTNKKVTQTTSYSTAVASPVPTSAKLPNTQPQQRVVQQTTTTVAPVGQVRRAPGPLSPEERQERIDNGKCLFCGVFGHIGRDCAERKKRDEARAHLKAVQEARNRDSESESGNVEEPSK